MRCVEHTARLEEWRGEVCAGFCCGNRSEKDALEDLNLDGNLILKLIFKECDGLVNCIDLNQDKHK